MKLAQKLTYLLALIFAVVNFIYTLAFSTNWAHGAARLGQFFMDAQAANQILFKLALYGMVFSGMAIVFNTHKNRKFYPTNYVFSGLSIIMFLIIGIVTFIKVIPLKSAYLLLDPIQLERVTLLNWSTPSVTIFNWGYGLASVSIMAAFMIGFITWYKFYKHVLRAKTKKSHLEVDHDYI